MLRGGDGRHFFNVLGGLFFHDIHDVIDGNDTDHAVLIVHHRHRREVVPLEHVRDFLLVEHGADGDDILVHDFADDFIGLPDQKIPECHRSDQNTRLIEYVADVDRLRIQADLTDSVDCILYGHILLQIHILDRQNRSCGILRVAKQMVDIRPRVRPCVCKNLLNDIGRHLFQKVRRIIGHQVVDDVRCFLIGKR